MRMAFGVESKEARRKFILDSTSKNMLLAVDNFDLEQDGRVKLSPFSVALFPKKKGDGAFPEINTIQCEEAYLTLDKAVTNLTELTSRHIIGVELRGAEGVNIVNNRRTPEKNDDVEISIKLAPVYYEERTNKIWTEGFVKLLDTVLAARPDQDHAPRAWSCSLPRKHTRCGARPARPSSKNDTVNGVELLILKSHVDMHLYVDAKSGFLAAQEGPASRRPSRPPLRTTAGRKSPRRRSRRPGRCTTTSPRNRPSSTAPRPPRRRGPHGAGPAHARAQARPQQHKYDQLVCDTLKLAFRRKAETRRRAKDPLSGNKEIEKRTPRRGPAP